MQPGFTANKEIDSGVVIWSGTVMELEFQEVCPLNEVYFSSWSFKMVSACAYDRCPLTRG